jgi:hypothetical protein
VAGELGDRDAALLDDEAGLVLLGDENGVDDGLGARAGRQGDGQVVRRIPVAGWTSSRPG